MAAPYQPSLLRLLHGATALLVSLAWITGLLLLGGLDGRFGRLPLSIDGEWIERHGQLGVALALVLLPFTAYALTLGAARLRRAGNLIPLLALALAVGAITNLVLGWLLGPGWGTSMGLIAVLAGLVLALGNRSDAS